jgi:hypothetical protein
MDRNPAPQLGQFVPIDRRIWINSKFDFQRVLHLPHLRLLLRRLDTARSGSSTFPEDTRQFANREQLCSGPGFKTRRNLSSVLHQKKTPLLRGNRTVVRCKLRILEYRRLIGGGNRKRTILHRRIPFNNPNLGPNWSLPVIRPEGVNECIGDYASSENHSWRHRRYMLRILKLLVRLRNRKPFSSAALTAPLVTSKPMKGE